jgi:hypothetical protein
MGSIHLLCRIPISMISMILKVSYLEFITTRYTYNQETLKIDPFNMLIFIRFNKVPQRFEKMDAYMAKKDPKTKVLDHLR